jgi:PAS domain S-box-containing protein
MGDAAGWRRRIGLPALPWVFPSEILHSSPMQPASRTPVNVAVGDVEKRKEPRILVIEPSNGVSQRIASVIAEVEPPVQQVRVAGAAEAIAALAAEPWDLIVCDESMAITWRKLWNAEGRNLPPVIICGTGGEDEAVRAIKWGAGDYIRKRRLERLAPAIERELRQADPVKARREIDAARVEALELILGRERIQAEEELRLREERTFRQREALVALAAVKPNGAGNLQAAFRRITEVTARALEVSRVSIWRYDSDRAAIHCEDQFELERERHSSGATLAIAKAPAYFRALSETDVVAVVDVSQDPRTLDFRDAYLIPHGIASMMDSAIRLDGVVDGVLCCEHVGEIRHWTGDEMAFSAAMANQVSLAIESDARSRAVARMLHSQTRFDILSQSINDAVYEWDVASGAIWWSTGFASLVGEQEEAETIDTWGERIHPQERESVLRGLAQAIADGSHSWAVEYRLRRADGSYAYVLDRGVVIRDEAGAEPRMLGTVVDLTEQRRAAAAVRESEARFRELAENVEKVFFSFDVVGRRLDYINPQFEGIWRMPRARILAEPMAFLERVHPHDRLKALRGYRRGLDGKNVDLEYRLLLPGGEVRWLRGTVYPVRNEAGGLRHLVGTARDITTQKKTLLQLARTNRALKMLSTCNEALIRTRDETRLLAAICRIAVQIGGYRMAWVGYAHDDEERTILPMAHAGDEGGYLSEISLTWSDLDPRGLGPGGHTIRTGEPTICEDISTADVGFRWRQEALERGFLSVSCLPLKSGDEIFGMLALYGGEVRDMAEDEVKLLMELAANLSYGIGHLRGENERRRIESAVSRMAASVSKSGGEAFFGQLVESMVEAVGADAGILADAGEGKPPRVLAAFAWGQEVAADELVISGESWAALLECPSDHVIGYSKWRPVIASRLGELTVRKVAGCRLVSSAGAPLGILLVLFQDIGARSEFITSTLRIFAARAAAELERQDADRRISEQASLLDEARDAILVWELDHRITYLNKSAERLYGWSRSEALGSSAERLIYRDPVAVQAAHAVLLETGEWQGELQQITKDGVEVCVEARWTLVRDSSGKPSAVLAINTDVTAHRNLERQLLRAQRLEGIGTLAGGIAHDLNNVLTPIIMSVELLRGSVRDARGAGLLDSIEQSARRGSAMVGHVLAFARGSGGRRIVVDVLDQIREVGKIASDTFPRNIEIRTSHSAPLWPVRGDPTQIHQVLLNLFVNSRDAMPAGGVIDVSADNVHITKAEAAAILDAVAGAYVRISVKDTGGGIPSHLLDRIFDPFFTTKEVGRGTGLGLSSSLSIIKGHRGFIQVHSQIGMGTCFLLHLPAASAGLLPPRPDLDADDLQRVGGETILIVDDEEPILSATRQVLETFGFRVIEARGGNEALEIFATPGREIDAILIDMMMPEMDGATLIRAILKRDPQARIVATSGLDGNRRAAGEAGARVFLRKPFNGATLIEALDKALAGAVDAGQG